MSNLLGWVSVHLVLSLHIDISPCSLIISNQILDQKWFIFKLHVRHLTTFVASIVTFIAIRSILGNHPVSHLVHWRIKVVGKLISRSREKFFLQIWSLVNFSRGDVIMSNCVKITFLVEFLLYFIEVHFLCKNIDIARVEFVSRLAH